MNRLTEHDDQGNWCLKGVAWSQLHTGSVITKKVREKLYGALCKLKDYEDTGLYPEEIMELKEFYENPLNTAVPAVHVMTQWIPVKEQLPENDNIVLVTCKSKKGLLGINRAYCDDSGFWHGSGSMSGVIAWMPLPEPYKEGDD